MFLILEFFLSSFLYFHSISQFICIAQYNFGTGSNLSIAVTPFSVTRGMYTVMGKLAAEGWAGIWTWSGFLSHTLRVWAGQEGGEMLAEGWALDMSWHLDNFFLCAALYCFIFILCIFFDFLHLKAGINYLPLNSTFEVFCARIQSEFHKHLLKLSNIYYNFW